jgi:hypothetical protein
VRETLVDRAGEVALTGTTRRPALRIITTTAAVV